MSKNNSDKQDKTKNLHSERLIVWFVSTDKKIQLNQFHVEAKSNKEALEILKASACFEYNVMGVSLFGNSDSFINKKFY